MTSTASPRRRPRPRNPWPRRVVIAAVAVLIFAVGIALGEALNDGPPPPTTETYVRTLTPVPQRPVATG